MAAGDLVTNAQALAALGLLTDPTNLVAGLVSAVSTQIQNFLGYQLAVANYTRTFNGTNSDRLLLPDRPIISVSSLTIDTIPVLQASPPGPGFLFDSKFLYLTPGNSRNFGVFSLSRFNRGIQNVVVSYSAGYSTIPFDIQQACLNWLQSAYALMSGSGDPSVKMLRAGDTQMEFGNIVTTLLNTVILLPPAIASALMPYQRVAAS